MNKFSDFTVVDGFAISLFFLVWIGHFYLTNSSRFRVHTISYQMLAVREAWMGNMVRRDGQPIDALIQNSLQQGVLFFGSTSVLLIGGLAAGLGATDSALSILNDVPWSTTHTNTQWQIKLMLILFIFVFAFFKFAWSYRLFNYVIIMIGAAPDPKSDSVVLDPYAKKIAALHALGAKHFTIGLNSYFFALAAFAWFINAWFLIAASIWVSLVLYRRAFRSNFSRIFKS